MNGMQNTDGFVPLLKALDLDAACAQLLEVEEASDLEQITDIGQVFELINHIGRLFDVSPQAASLRETFEERINIIIHKLKFIDQQQRPFVALIHEDGSLANHNYLHTLIRTAGGRVYQANEPDVQESAGTLIFLADGMYHMLGGLPQLLDQPVWKDSDAVKHNQVFLVEHTQQLNGNLLQVADDIELLAELIYPQYFVFSESGEGWMKFEL